MKPFIAGVAVVLMSSMVLAGPFIGAEIVLHYNYGAIPYFTMGWDSGSWIKTSFGMSNPGYADGWYLASVTPLFNVSPSFRIGGSLSVLTLMQNWQFQNMEFRVSADAVIKWRGIMWYVRLFMPAQPSTELPLLGATISFGIAYDFFPYILPAPQYLEPGPDWRQ